MILDILASVAFQFIDRFERRIETPAYSSFVFSSTNKENIRERKKLSNSLYNIVCWLLKGIVTISSLAIRERKFRCTTDIDGSALNNRFINLTSNNLINGTIRIQLNIFLNKEEKGRGCAKILKFKLQNT